MEVSEFNFGDVELLEDPLHLLLSLPCVEQVRKDEELVLEADSFSNLFFLPPPPPPTLQSKEEARRLVISRGPADLGISEKVSREGGREEGHYLGSSLYAHPLEIEGSALSLRRRIYGTADIQVSIFCYFSVNRNWVF